MSEERACEVCQRPGHAQCFGISLCQRCHDTPKLAPEVQMKVTVEQRNELNQLSVVRVFDVQAEIERGKPVDVQVRFMHERVGHKLMKIFRSELQAGDEAFDDAIYICDAKGAGVQALIAIPGARAAIVALVGNDNEIAIESSTIRFSAHDEGGTDVDGYLRAGLALSQHLQSLA